MSKSLSLDDFVADCLRSESVVKSDFATNNTVISELALYDKATSYDFPLSAGRGVAKRTSMRGLTSPLTAIPTAAAATPPPRQQKDVSSSAESAKLTKKLMQVTQQLETEKSKTIGHKDTIKNLKATVKKSNTQLSQLKRSIEVTCPTDEGEVLQQRKRGRPPKPKQSEGPPVQKDSNILISPPAAPCDIAQTMKNIPNFDNQSLEFLKSSVELT